MTKPKFRIEQIAPQWQRIWAVTEWFYWNQEVNDILKRDVDGTLFEAAYNAVDWESYYERLKGTPFYDWAVEGGGILSFGGPAHIERDCFFSTIGDMSTVEGDWLEEHPEFNQVLHDIHVETAEQMIDHLLTHGQKKRKRRRRRRKHRQGDAQRNLHNLLGRVHTKLSAGQGPSVVEKSRPPLAGARPTRWWPSTTT